MKKKIAKICAFILAVLILVITIVIGIIVFLFDYEGSKRPNDAISKAICEAVGKKIYIIKVKDLITYPRLLFMII